MLIVYTTMPSARTCNDPAAEGASITVDGNCWTHTHKDMWNINDLSYIQPYMPSAIKNYAKMDPHHLVVTALNGGECLCGSAVQPLGAHVFLCNRDRFRCESVRSAQHSRALQLPGGASSPSDFEILSSLFSTDTVCTMFHFSYRRVLDTPARVTGRI